MHALSTLVLLESQRGLEQQELIVRVSSRIDRGNYQVWNLSTVICGLFDEVVL